jgi:hypothetical protein
MQVGTLTWEDEIWLGKSGILLEAFVFQMHPTNNAVVDAWMNPSICRRLKWRVNEFLMRFCFMVQQHRIWRSYSLKLSCR